jgi:hypothetical protein
VEEAAPRWGESLFGDGRRWEHDEGLTIQTELFTQIGRLNMKVEWLKENNGPR